MHFEDFKKSLTAEKVSTTFKYQVSAVLSGASSRVGSHPLNRNVSHQEKVKGNFSLKQIIDGPTSPMAPIGRISVPTTCGSGTVPTCCLCGPRYLDAGTTMDVKKFQKLLAKSKAEFKVSIKASPSLFLMLVV